MATGVLGCEFGEGVKYAAPPFTLPVGVTGRSLGGEPKTGVSRLDGCLVRSFSPDFAGVDREGA